MIHKTSMNLKQCHFFSHDILICYHDIWIQSCIKRCFKSSYLKARFRHHASHEKNQIRWMLLCQAFLPPLPPPPQIGRICRLTSNRPLIFKSGALYKNAFNSCWPLLVVPGTKASFSGILNAVNYLRVHVINWFTCPHVSSATETHLKRKQANPHLGGYY